MCDTHVYLFTHEKKKIQLAERIDIDNASIYINKLCFVKRNGFFSRLKKKSWEYVYIENVSMK